MKTLGSWSTENGPTFNVEFTDLDEELRFLRRMVSGPELTVRDRLGIAHTIGNCRSDPVIRNLAVDIIRNGAEQRDKKGQAIAIAQWVQDNIYYVHEMPERFQTPRETLRTKAGDCDDSAQLVGSMLESIGIPAMLACMYVDFQWRHIYPCAVMPKTNALLPLDTTLQNHRMGEVWNPALESMKLGKYVKLKLA
jgi:transglutaminase-like putative cysteine protease